MRPPGSTLNWRYLFVDTPPAEGSVIWMTGLPLGAVSTVGLLLPAFGSATGGEAQAGRMPARRSTATVPARPRAVMTRRPSTGSGRAGSEDPLVVSLSNHERTPLSERVMTPPLILRRHH